MTTRDTTQIYETIRDDLLDEKSQFTITFVDRSGNRHFGTEAVEICNPFDIDVSRFVPNERVMDLPRFIEVAQQLLADAQEREGTVSGKRISLLAEYLTEDFARELDGEVITWRLISREPAKMNAKGTGRPQRRAGFSHDLRTPSLPNKVVTVSTRPLDHVVEFTVWSKDAARANRRALWLERLFIAHTWAFKIQGADHFIFLRRLADNYRTTGGQGLYERPLRFQVRLLEFEVRAEPEISHLEIEVGLASYKLDT